MTTKVYRVVIRNLADFDNEVGERVYSEESFTSDEQKEWEESQIAKAIRRGKEDRDIEYVRTDFETVAYGHYVH